MNDRKRAEAKEKPKKHVTRNRYKQKERLKKECQRANQTEGKKQAILARRRELYAENKAKERSTALQEENKLRETEEKLKKMDEQFKAKVIE